MGVHSAVGQRARCPECSDLPLQTIRGQTSPTRAGRPAQSPTGVTPALEDALVWASLFSSGGCRFSGLCPAPGERLPVSRPLRGRKGHLPRDGFVPGNTAVAPPSCQHASRTSSGARGALAAAGEVICIKPAGKRCRPPHPFGPSPVASPVSVRPPPLPICPSGAAPSEHPPSSSPSPASPPPARPLYGAVF